MENIDCPHFKWCSGCSLDKDVGNPPLLKEAEEYFRNKELSFPFYVGRVRQWRMRAKLAVRGSYENPLVGLFKKNTHETLDIPFCQVHHPSINKAADLLRLWIKENAIVPYQEDKGVGELRYVQFVAERATGKVQATLVFNTTAWKPAVLEKLWEMDPLLWHSLWVNENLQQTNTIFGPQWHLFKGEELLWEKIAGADVCFLPSSFGQSNLEAFEKMVISLQTNISLGAKIGEYYAGGGVMSLGLAPKAQKILCCEVNPLSQRCFELSKHRLAMADQEKITYHVGRAGELASLMEDLDTVIADPPRKGLEPFFIEGLCRSNKIEKFIYVSCGWHSFKRDCEILLNHQWRLQLAEGYLFFPGTDHIETLAVFKRS